MTLAQIFDPALFLPPLVGGGLIGLAAAITAVFNGRVAGVSGIVAGALTAGGAERRRQIAFIVGLCASPFLYALFDPTAWDVGPTAPLPTAAVAGLLVGVGAGLGSGCTSGHGVCGLARGSARSLAAVVVFMSAAAAAVFVARHVVGG